MFTVRIGDIAVGICPCPPSMCPATGVVASGDPQAIDSGTPRARLGDQVLFPCGPFTIMMGGPNHINSGMPDTDIGASCIGAGSGVIVSGNPRHIKV